MRPSQLSSMAMTSLRQIEANRGNALKSTGPTSEAGKERSRRNAVRHGLTAETVVEPLEDPEQYKAFELSITSEFDAQTAVERELVLRLASVLWRLRRSTAIETALLQIGKLGEERAAPTGPVRASSVPSFAGLTTGGRLTETNNTGVAGRKVQPSDVGTKFNIDCFGAENAAMARRFLRLAKFDGGAFERLNRYETALWRQATQLLFALNFLHRPPRRQSVFPSKKGTPFLFGSRR
jgi:hypothetical protein